MFISWEGLPRAFRAWIGRCEGHPPTVPSHKSKSSKGSSALSSLLPFITQVTLKTVITDAELLK